MSKNSPARNVEILVRAPETFTLIMVCPIMAHPPMPPKKPVTMFATPCPHASRLLFEWVLVMSSTSLAVISDSRMPTSAIANAYGAMICSVSRLSGTLGKISDGRRSGSAPSSPTVGTLTANATVTAVSTTIATRGAGTTLVRRGRNTITAIPAATI